MFVSSIINKSLGLPCNRGRPNTCVYPCFILKPTEILKKKLESLISLDILFRNTESITGEGAAKNVKIVLWGQKSGK